MLRAVPLLVLLALAGCGGDDNAQGSLSRGEEKQLDAAAAAIDVNAMDNTQAAQ